MRSKASAWATVRGKAVEKKPRLGVRLVDAVGDDADHDIVGDEFTPVHDRLGLLADRRSRSDGSAEHVAGRELRDPEPLHHADSLRPLPRPGGPRRISLMICAPSGFRCLQREPRTDFCPGKDRVAVYKA
jgi:hypothetical protein